MHYVNSASINNLITSHIDNDYNSLKNNGDHFHSKLHGSPLSSIFMCVYAYRFNVKILMLSNLHVQGIVLVYFTLIPLIPSYFIIKSQIYKCKSPILCHIV